jgi:hypothetical protein
MNTTNVFFTINIFLLYNSPMKLVPHLFGNNTTSHHRLLINPTLS